MSNRDPFRDSFMQPFTYHGDYWYVETSRGDFIVPCDGEAKCDAVAYAPEWIGPIDEDDIGSVTLRTGWYGRMSAPGYLDCTDWESADSEEALMASFVEKYGSEYDSDDDGDDSDPTDDGDDEPTFSVIEYSSFFAVRHNPTGREASMGDGVDTLFNDDCTPMSPGDPGFVEQWAESLNSDEEETLAAYFPDLADDSDPDDLPPISGGAPSGWDRIDGDDEVPNLDAMEPDELDELAANVPTRFLAWIRELITRYCVNKALAMRARAAGNITTALSLESVCDQIYHQIPERYRW